MINEQPAPHHPHLPPHSAPTHSPYPQSCWTWTRCRCRRCATLCTSRCTKAGSHISTPSRPRRSTLCTTPTRTCCWVHPQAQVGHHKGGRGFCNGVYLPSYLWRACMYYINVWQVDCSICFGVHERCGAQPPWCLVQKPVSHRQERLIRADAASAVDCAPGGKGRLHRPSHCTTAWSPPLFTPPCLPPTGKTASSQLALLRLFTAHPGEKAIYIAPLNASLFCR